jgi:hypothetical protein
MHVFDRFGQFHFCGCVTHVFDQLHPSHFGGLLAYVFNRFNMCLIYMLNRIIEWDVDHTTFLIRPTQVGLAEVQQIKAT